MDERIHKLALPLFIVWPFGGFLLSLTKLKAWTSGLVFVLFCAVFGFSFAFESTSEDSYRVAFVFQQFKYSSLRDIYLIYREGGSTDLYRFLMYGITKIFTNNPKVLYALFGTVFGLFLYLSLRLMVIEKGDKNNIFFFLIIFFFFSFYPISAMNGARFNTTAWIFFYSSVNFLFLDKKKWSIGVLLTPLFHFSFFFIIPIVFVFYFFKNLFYSKTITYNWLFYLYLASIVFFLVSDTNAINISFLRESEIFSSSINRKIDIYTSNKVTEAVENNQSIVRIIGKPFGILMSFYFLFFLVKARQVIAILEGRKNYHKLLSFIFIFLSFGNFASSMPSGGRFRIVAYLFVLYLMLKLYKLLPKTFNNYVLWGIPVFSFTILFSVIYLSLKLTDPSIWYANLVYIIINGLNFTKELIL